MKNPKRFKNGARRSGTISRYQLKNGHALSKYEKYLLLQMENNASSTFPQRSAIDIAGGHGKKNNGYNKAHRRNNSCRNH